MSIDKIKKLIEIVPSPEEQLETQRMSQYEDVDNFGITESFFYALHDIVELKPRLNTWIFKHEFDTKCQELEKKITIIEKAKLAITLSKNLRELFQVILSWGNHLNFGNSIGNAYGFHLKDLLLVT